MSDREEKTAIADEPQPTYPPRAGREATLVVGDVLNGIYKVERFIARGGMGEVFEGVNVESDERVAIKAIRSHLASDPKVVTLFRKEARILTHIAHPAIVQYRVFARDPVLDLHYIVTDFINGEPITAHLDGQRPGIRDVVTLARRLAAGLEAAHDHGAIHRDMSPDNVLLPDGKIERAKIIDFGIAKSLDITAETVVGEGFAGKLGYVAPEQFGDFGRQVGPWTDVYSTALVLLAFARGKAPAMGTTLSEAVERRRVGPDLTDLPLPLAPLIERMLVPDPAARVRSMREVLAALDNVRLPDAMPVPIQTSPPKAPQPPSALVSGEAPEQDMAPGAEPSQAMPPSDASVPIVMTTFAPVPTVPEAAPSAAGDGRRNAGGGAKAKPGTGPSPSPARKPAATRAAASRPARNRWVLVGVPVAAVALASAFALDLGRPTPAPAPAAFHQPAPRTAAPDLSAADRASRVNGLFAEMPCTWVNARPTTEGGPTALSGGAGDLNGVTARLAANARSLGPADSAQVRPANVTQCGVIDALRPFRASGPERDAGILSLSSSVISLAEANPSCPQGRGGAVEITAANYDPNRDFALISLQPDGQLLQIAGSRQEFETLARRDATRFNIGADGLYHTSLCYGLAGSAAVVLIESRGPLDLGLRTGVATVPPADFAQRIADRGRRQEIRIFAEWALIDGTARADAVASVPAPGAGDAAAAPLPAAAPTPRAQSQYGPLGERSRVQAAIDTADANRLELARIQALRTGSVDTGGTAVCRRFDGSWKDVGRLGRDECIARAIQGRCNVSFAMYKHQLFRRQYGRIQEQRGSRWRDVAEDRGC